MLGQTGPASASRSASSTIIRKPLPSTPNTNSAIGIGEQPNRPADNARRTAMREFVTGRLKRLGMALNEQNMIDMSEDVRLRANGFSGCADRLASMRADWANPNQSSRHPPPLSRDDFARMIGALKPDTIKLMFQARIDKATDNIARQVEQLLKSSKSVEYDRLYKKNLPKARYGRDDDVELGDMTPLTGAYDLEAMLRSASERALSKFGFQTQLSLYQSSCEDLERTLEEAFRTGNDGSVSDAFSTKLDTNVAAVQKEQLVLLDLWKTFDNLDGEVLQAVTERLASAWKEQSDEDKARTDKKSRVLTKVALGASGTALVFTLVNIVFTAYKDFHG